MVLLKTLGEQASCERFQGKGFQFLLLLHQMRKHGFWKRNRIIILYYICKLTLSLINTPNNPFANRVDPDHAAPTESTLFAYENIIDRTLNVLLTIMYSQSVELVKNLYQRKG
jgi:hypothetical protein